MNIGVKEDVGIRSYMGCPSELDVVLGKMPIVVPELAPHPLQAGSELV